MENIVTKYLKKIWHDSARENNKILASLIDQKNKSKILDLGCDTGHWIIDRLRNKIKIPDIYGIEIQSKLVIKAQKHGIKAIKADVEKNLPFKNNYFDIISANQIIEHIVNIDHVFEEVHRILKPGGYLIISTENLSSWHNIFALIFGWQAFSQHISKIKNVGNPLRLLEFTNSLDTALHVKIFTPRGLKELVELHGLVVEKIFGAGYYPFPVSISRTLSSLDPTHSAFIGLKARKPA